MATFTRRDALRWVGGAATVAVLGLDGIAARCDVRHGMRVVRDVSA